MKSLIALMFFAACGSSSSSNVDSNPGGGDGPHGDAVVVASSIMITGTATAPGVTTTNVSGATIGAYQAADDSLVMMTTTDASGNFTLTIPTNGVALDGYLKATLTSYVDTYLYPPAPLTANFSGAAVEMVTQSTLGLVNTIAHGQQADGNGLIAVEVEDASGMTVAGATVASSPASTAYRYDGTGSSLPDPNATSTQADGVGYMFNTPAGPVTVSAMKTGTTFASHKLKAWAGALTTTLITP